MTETTRRTVMGLIAGTAVATVVPVNGTRAKPVPVDDLAGPWTGGGEIACGGGRLRYVTLGPTSGPAIGEPLVLLPKLGGWIADWRLAAPYLAAHRQVIAFDLPGHGGSVMAGPPPAIMTVPECTAMILAALDEIGVTRCAMAGNSLGGIIAIVGAACWPERVSKLIIVSSSLIGPMSRDAIAEQDRGITAAGAAAASGGPQPPTDEQNRLFATMDPRVTVEQGLSRAKAGPWLRACERGVGRVGVTDYLPRVCAPTLLINADRGRYAKYAAVGLKLIPNARAVVITGAGSFVHQEKPMGTAAAMTGFLDG